MSAVRAPFTTRGSPRATPSAAGRWNTTTSLAILSKKAKVTLPKRIRLRETQAFYPEEQRTILQAALKIEDVSKPDDAARRWVPWLCAYTGARVGEITQLRGSDVIKRDGTHAILITPEAGTLKNGEARVVPLHEHLLEQGFVEFVQERGDGPLFYKPAPQEQGEAPAKPKKPRYQQAQTTAGGLGTQSRHHRPVASAQPRLAAYVQANCRPGGDFRAHF